MKEHLGKRVLVTVGDNDAAQMTCIAAFSTNGKYVLLDESFRIGACFGWVLVDTVKVLDVLGSVEETGIESPPKFLARLAALIKGKQ